MSVEQGMAFLSSWYQRQCNGDWEHELGVELKTSEGGWHLRVDLDDTDLEGRTARMEPIDRSETDWLHVHSDGRHFDASCGVGNLGEALESFEDFATA